MDSDQYKKIVNENNILSYECLAETVLQLNAVGEYELASKLNEIARTGKVPRPDKHNSPELDQNIFCKVELACDEVEYIVDMFLILEARSVDPFGNATWQTSNFAFLVDKWRRLLKEEN